MFYNTRNLREIETLDPVARERFATLLVRLEEAGEDILITDPRRSVQEQNDLYAQGRTKPGNIVTDARGDASFHVWGVAIDLVPVGLFGQLQYGAVERYRQIALAAAALQIDWGVVLWRKDAPHFQYTQGLSIADFRAGKRLVPLVAHPQPPTREELEQRLRVAERALPRASERRKILLTRFIKRAVKIIRGV